MKLYDQRTEQFFMSQTGDILIVDDSGTNLFLLQRLLEDEGYSVIITEDPKKGLDYVDKHSGIRLILLDIMMPQLDGFEFMKRLSDRGKITEIPVIIVTARDDSQSHQKAMDLGAKDYIEKPLNIKKVLDTIQYHIS
ncbi:MAG: response regulator [Bacteroidales bacterium]|nr:response regulator [Bacteroidales bacterium]MBS3774790.1 response regulator [Bacteroidales bacterium]